MLFKELSKKKEIYDVDRINDLKSQSSFSLIRFSYSKNLLNKFFVLVNSIVLKYLI